MSFVTRGTAFVFAAWLAVVLGWCYCVQPSSARCSKAGAYMCNRRACVPHTSRSCTSSCTICRVPANGRSVCGSRSTCSFECKPGFEVSGSRCQLCRPGFFKAGWSRNSRCQPCPPGTMTVGSDGGSRDNINDCVTPSSECRHYSSCSYPPATKRGRQHQIMYFRSCMYLFLQ